MIDRELLRVATISGQVEALYKIIKMIYGMRYTQVPLEYGNLLDRLDHEFQTTIKKL